MTAIFDNVVVKKPWGEEYLCYRNGDVAIWHLYIKKGEKTSMHCHPTKNTGFVVLDGKVQLSFIRNKMNLTGLDKIHIFRSRFHSTQALTDSFLFEIESPEDKADLVRLDDSYGREDSGYEDSGSFKKKGDNHFWLDDPEKNVSCKLHDCSLHHFKPRSIEDLLRYSEKDFIVFTKGGVGTASKKQILYPGDIADGETLARIAVKFELISETSILTISKQ